jgi:hypothetical protein
MEKINPLWVTLGLPLMLRKGRKTGLMSSNHSSDLENFVYPLRLGKWYKFLGPGKLYHSPIRL